MVSAITAGNLDRRIGIYDPPTGTDDAGQATITGTLHATVSARQIKPSGRELTQGGKDTAEQRAVYEIRWNSWVAPKMTIRDGSANYRIERIEESGVRDGLLLVCTRLI